jgi:hypothetical protein
MVLILMAAIRRESAVAVCQTCIRVASANLDRREACTTARLPPRFSRNSKSWLPGIASKPNGHRYNIGTACQGRLQRQLRRGLCGRTVARQSQS